MVYVNLAMSVAWFMYIFQLSVYTQDVSFVPAICMVGIICVLRIWWDDEVTDEVASAVISTYMSGFVSVVLPDAFSVVWLAVHTVITALVAVVVAWACVEQGIKELNKFKKTCHDKARELKIREQE